MGNTRSPAPSPKTSEDVCFFNGDIKLSGTLHLPTRSGPYPAIVVLHAASGGTRDFHAYQHLATALPAAGFATLLFDRRGAGDSEGDFSTARFDDLAADALAGVALLKARQDIESSKIGVWGVSQGGWLGPLAATMSSEVAFVVSVSGPGVSPARQMDYAAAYWLQAGGQPANVVEQAMSVRSLVNEYYRGRASRSDAEQAIDMIRHASWFEQVFLPNSGNLPSDPRNTKWDIEMDYDPLSVIARVRVPIAFFFAETDAWVPVEESIVNIQRVTQSHSEVTIWRIPGTDHLMETGMSDADRPISEHYLKLLIEWLDERTRR
jgi:pimeloyl-ACP methyl ester carboxylesterase